MRKLKISLENDIPITNEQESLDNAALRDSINQSIQEDKKVLDVADNLTDMASVVSTIKEPTDKDIALIQIGANMAVAGTDDNACDLIPCTESLKDPKQAVKELYAKIQYAHESLGTSHLSIWERIKLSVKNFFSWSDRVENRIEELRNAIKFIDKEKPDSSIKRNFRTNNVYFFDSNGDKLTNIKDVIAELKQTLELVNKYRDLTFNAIRSYEKSDLNLFKFIKDKSSYEEDIKRYFNNFLATFITPFTSVDGVIKQKHGTIISTVNDNFIGLKYYSIDYPDENSYSKSDVKGISTALDEIEFRGLISKPRLGYGGFSVETNGTTTKDLYEYLKVLENLVKSISKLYDNKIWDKVSEIGESVSDYNTGIQHSNNQAVSIIGNAIQAGVNTYKRSTIQHKMKIKERDAIWNSAYTITQYCEGIFDAHEELIDHLVNEKNWN